MRTAALGLGYALGWRCARLLPARIAETSFALAAEAAARRRGPRVRQLRGNLARIVPKAGPHELDELLGKALRSYARYWREVFRLAGPEIPRAVAAVEAQLDGGENLDAALRAGRGAVIALPHSGNWEVAGMWLVSRVARVTTVAERLEPESLFRRFVRYRESLGFEVLAGDSSPYDRLAARLRDNGVVALVADRNLGAAGIEVDFFGERARFPAGPARLAADTGAALLPLGCWFTEVGWGLRIHPRIRVNGPGEVAAGTQLLADCFAGDIAAHPADWHMMQPLWLADLPKRAPRDEAGAGESDPP